MDYIDVAARIVEFRNKFPEGSLQQLDLKFIDFAGKSWVVYTAAAYRTPDDTRPGVGTAWEPVPGPTQFTRDSEVQNAETAAWGRAIVASLAADTKKGIASAEEVRNRQVESAPSASDEILGQITDGVAMLQPDEKAAFRAWWKERKFPKLEDLLQPEAQILYARLLGILNATAEESPENVAQGHTEPSEVIAEAFGDVEEVRTDSSGITAPMITNPQRGKLRALLGDSPESKVSEILKREVTILGQITKAEASKVITQLEADKL
jgi:hypothetical protein